MMLWRIGYRLLLWLSFPAVVVRLWRRGRDEPGYRQARGERCGRPLIWVHAVSLGETRAAEPLVRALIERYPGHRFLITHMTATGREAAQQLYGQLSEVSVAWLPYDYPLAMRRFLRRFKPTLGIIMETEIWFNLLRECRRAQVPVVLANARLSEQSARGYAMVAPLIREALGQLSALAVQNEDDAKRLVALGADATHITVTGNLKFDMPLDADQDGERQANDLRKYIAARPVLLAASTREGEEELLLDALATHPLPPGTLLLIVPRHPQRFDEVAGMLQRRGLHFQRRSALGPDAALSPDCAVLLGDSMGEMAKYYRAADCAFIGGSLMPLGGQNLIEACALGVPVLVGRHTFNFAQAADEAVAAGAALRVDDAEGLLREAQRLLGDEASRRRMRAAGIAFVAAHRGATARTLQACEPFLK
jgi:3-deoxy-D-manno-octulosonic-acid transferase